MTDTVSSEIQTGIAETNAVLQTAEEITSTVPALASEADRIKSLETIITEWSPIIDHLSKLSEEAKEEGETIASIIKHAGKKLLGIF